MAGEDGIILVDNDGRNEAERLDTCCNLLDLLVRMLAGIPFIRFELLNRQHGNVSIF
jgi:hypothetical protein